MSIRHIAGQAQNTTISKIILRPVSSLLVLSFVIIATGTPANAKECPGNKNALGISRTVQIDTTGGPGFGFQHYKAYDFLQPGEVVLTFDDGPLPGPTRDVLKALADHCVKAVFFPVGKLAAGYPEVLRRVADAGHTIGSHTWSHKDLARMKKDDAVNDMEKAVSAVRLAANGPTAPFFRFPYLKDTDELLAYLGQRNFASFSTDLDSFDFKTRSSKKLIKNVMAKLKRRGKGILLFHDINKVTAKSLPKILDRLQKEGYKIVHMTAKNPAITIPAMDEEVAKLFKGRPDLTGARPMSDVIQTVTESTD